ncbi:Holliday junction DNA helicase RuvB C-terminal domain-containing protein, partial [Mycobacterium kansasii]|uniref:Holliday junction DNA helicase RuvB C-terminal domain-containing protein n=1 Tax=Mycobacterium kansasii TaxID=1768 RepID=UPI00287BBF64
EVYDVDELGLDRLDRAVLSALTRSFGGGPVGVSTLAVASVVPATSAAPAARAARRPRSSVRASAAAAARVGSA